MKTINKIFSVLFLTLLTISCTGANWYVDNSAVGGNGLSWSTAVKSLSSISPSPGDTIYISGGPSGSSQTYSIGGTWVPKSGTSLGRITYTIGQDSLHNGVVIFNGSGAFISTVSYVNIIGDAGDGKQHFATSGYSAITGGNFNNLRIGYINFGKMLGNYNGACIYGSTVNNFEFDHNYIYQNSTTSDAIIHVDSYSGSGYDQNLIHDNVLYTPGNGGGGIGADGLVMSGSGFSIYNNIIINYKITGYSASQHSDGWQTSGGQYIKIYNNLIWGFSDIGLYGGCWGNAVAGGPHTFSHVRIYNNVIDGGVGQQDVGCIEVEADNQTGSTFSDIGIFNNFCRVPTSTQGWGIFIGSSSTTGGVWSNVWATNNFIVAPTSGQRMYIINAPGFVESNNPLFNDSQAQSMMVRFVPGDFTSDYHLLSSANGVINKGINMSYYFNFDKDGNPRPTSGAWDIGAYQFSTNNIIINTNPIISISSSNLDFGSISTNTSKNLSITVSNSGNSILNGFASVSQPFIILSGGQYNLNPKQSQNIVFSFYPINSGTFFGSAILTGGTGASISLNGIATNIPIIINPTNTIYITNYATIYQTNTVILNIPIYLTNTVSILQTNINQIYKTNIIIKSINITNYFKYLFNDIHFSPDGSLMILLFTNTPAN